MPVIRLSERIVADEGILGGKPVIAGTRVSVAAVLGQLGRGVSAEDVALRFEIAHEDVLAAIRFAAGSMDRDSYVAAAR